MRTRTIHALVLLHAVLMHVCFVGAGEAAVVLHDCRIIDGHGGAALEHGAIVIQGGRIVEAGPADTIKTPASAQVIDCAGKTVLPGLISDHSHVGQVDGISSGAQNYNRENIIRQLRQYEAYGVTTVVSLGLNAPLFGDMRSAAHAGEIPGADLFGADRGIGAPNGGPPVKLGTDQLYRPQDADEGRLAVREMVERKTDLIKLWLDDFNGSVPVKIKPEVYQAIIDEAHHLRVRVAAHIYYLADATALLQAGVDILAHGVRDQPVNDEFIQLLKSKDAWYIATLDLNEASFIYAQHPDWMQTAFFQHALQPALRTQLEDPAWQRKTLAEEHRMNLNSRALGINQKNLRVIFDAGARIGFGTDSGASPVRISGFAEHRELRLMTDAGILPLEAITIATRNAAALLKLSDRGVIEAGKLADLLVVNGNPAEHIGDIDKIDSVWHRGKRGAGSIEEFKP